MTAYLTFALAAPLAAMGAVAVGERREIWPRPARSAVLGLLAACLGLRRDEEEAHAALEAGYALALLMEGAGAPLQDYHTAQMPPARRGRRFATRAAELAVPKPELNTVLTRRDYRQEVLCLAALWPRPGVAAARWTLDDLAAAMERPRFAPCFGRKSCPLGLPPAPLVIEAPDPLAALARRREEGKEAAMRAWPGGQRLLPRAEHPRVAMDAADARDLRLRTERSEWRRDSVASRHRWQFLLREEAILPLSPSGEGTAP